MTLVLRWADAGWITGEEEHSARVSGVGEDEERSGLVPRNNNLWRSEDNIQLVNKTAPKREFIENNLDG